MLASKYRLKGQYNFDKVRKRGKTYKTDLYGISVLERGDNEVSRFAAVVSKKVTNMATQRNRIKRAITEAVRFDIGYVRKGYDVVFLVKKAALRASTDELMKEVKTALRRYKLLRQ
jgi:ribonuclease P protein component